MTNLPIEAFYDEAFELIEIIEKNILCLEKDPHTIEIVNKIFRALHTIKGTGSMFGLNKMTGLAHSMENIFDLIRNQKIAFNNQIVELTLQSCDIMKYLLTNKEVLNTDMEKQLSDLLNSLNLFLPDAQTKQNQMKSPKEESDNDENNPDKKIYRIIFEAGPTLLSRGINPKNLFNELNELGSNKIFAEMDKNITFEKMNPEYCYTKWIIILTTHHDINKIKDIFIFTESDSTVNIEIIDDDVQNDMDINYKKIGDILIEYGDISQEDVIKILNNKQLFGETAKKLGIVTDNMLNKALYEQNLVRDQRKKRTGEVETATIRVKHEKLDELINNVGELVTLQAKLMQIAKSSNNSEINYVAERLDRLAANLRENTMSLRMIPLSQTFNTFQRLVRDTAKHTGKEIELIINDTDTELDKNVIEILKEIIIHIMRNSIDHGIELTEERIKKGKDPQGQIKMSAEYSGANVLIKISDDGKGLDLDKIKEKAINKNLIPKNTLLSKNEIISLIFEPGFSTSEVATELSGRGVGMDIVKKNINKLRGSIEIESEKDKGTTVILKIPLTMAIIDGLLMEINKDFFIVNLSYINECIEYCRENKNNRHKNKTISLRNEIIPFVDLREYLNIRSEPPDIEQIVITDINNKKMGFKVDRVIGQYQTVIKTTGKIYKNIEEISGASILGDGTIALILDINKIIQKEESKS